MISLVAVMDENVKLGDLKVLLSQFFAKVDSKDVFDKKIIEILNAFYMLKLPTEAVFRPATYLKRDSNAGAFLRNLRNFLEHLFLQNTSGGCV